jgi:bifunctional non-homologous end joining protein LigD
MTRRTLGALPDEPLPLEFAPAATRLPERVVPMRPTDGTGPFDDPRYFFEPWWPGVRAFVFVEAGRVRLRAEALADPLPAFPELAGIVELVAADGVVLDATLMVLDARGRPSRDLLDRRLAGSGGGTAALVAADLLHLEGASLADRPFGERRGELAALLRPSPWCLAGRGFVGDGTTVAEALGALGFGALSARRLDARLREGPAGDAWYRVPVAAAPRTLPPLLAVFRRLPL